MKTRCVRVYVKLGKGLRVMTSFTVLRITLTDRVVNTLIFN